MAQFTGRPRSSSNSITAIIGGDGYLLPAQRNPYRGSKHSRVIGAVVGDHRGAGGSAQHSRSFLERHWGVIARIVVTSQHTLANCARTIGFGECTGHIHGR